MDDLKHSINSVGRSNDRSYGFKTRTTLEAWKLVQGISFKYVLFSYEVRWNMELVISNCLGKPHEARSTPGLCFFETLRKAPGGAFLRNMPWTR